MQPSIFTGITNLSSLRAYLVNDLDAAFNEEPTLDGITYCQDAVQEALSELPTSTLTVIMQDKELRYMWGITPPNIYMSLERNFIELLRIELTATLAQVYGEMLDSYGNQVGSESSPWDDDYVVTYDWEDVG